MIKEAIGKLVEKQDLTQAEMSQAFEHIMSGQSDPAQIAAFITALRMKGETVDEITAAARIMRKFAATIEVGGKSGREAIVDTCGTGGSGKNTFNVSTAAAFVVAGCGIKVAKHGNRSASSHCGSADVLEALGVNLKLNPEEVAECINSIGIGFLFAPLFHSAMKHAAAVRKAIGIRTIFNILGPLSNPANANVQLLGVYDKNLTKVMAAVLGNLGIKRAFVVHGMDGLDEISISAPTQVSELKNKKVKTYVTTPAKYGIKKASLNSIKGASPQDNAKNILSVLEGKKGPRRDVVVLNAAYAIYGAGLTSSIKDAIKIGENAIDSKTALEKLNQLKSFTNSHKQKWFSLK